MQRGKNEATRRFNGACFLCLSVLYTALATSWTSELWFLSTVEAKYELLLLLLTVITRRLLAFRLSVCLFVY